MKVFWVLIFGFLAAYCTPSQKVTAENFHLTYTPPNGIKVSDSLYCDQTEMTNVGWREYMHWLTRIFGDSSDELQTAVPDTLLWNKAPRCLNDYREYYHRHPSFNTSPVVGITQNKRSLTPGGELTGCWKAF